MKQTLRDLSPVITYLMLPLMVIVVWAGASISDEIGRMLVFFALPLAFGWCTFLVMDRE